MTLDQVKTATTKYEAELGKRGYKPVEHSKVPFPSTRDSLEHAAWMCGELRKMAEAGETEKAMRWLGFVQAVAWTTGIYSIDAMRADNRQDPA